MWIYPSDHHPMLSSNCFVIMYLSLWWINCLSILSFTVPGTQKNVFSFFWLIIGLTSDGLEKWCWWDACCENALKADHEEVMDTRHHWLDWTGLGMSEVAWLKQDKEQWTKSVIMLLTRGLKLNPISTRPSEHSTHPHLASDLQRVSHLNGRRRLRSSTTSALVVPRTVRGTIGDRTFPAAAASVWNSLLESVRASPSLQVFRSRLKTELFARSYSCSD